MNVLLVDDELLALDVLKKRVQEVLPSAKRKEFTDPEQALDWGKENSIDIAFLGINMRALDGITLAKELKACHPRLNIIFCTGYTEYMKDALDLYCSGYLIKPITREDMEKAVNNLRYPVEDKKVSFRCFGNFEAYYGDKPIDFKYTRTKELLAYLIDRCGADCTTAELMAVLFGDEQRREYFKKLRADLLSTFEALGEASAIRTSRGQMGIEKSLVSCDYYDYLDGKIETKPVEYMSQFGFSEHVIGKLPK